MEKLTKEEMHKLKEKLLKAKKHYEKILAQEDKINESKEKFLLKKKEIEEKIKEINKEMDRKETKITSSVKITMPSLTTVIGILTALVVFKSIMTITILTKAITFLVGVGICVGITSMVAVAAKKFINEDLEKIINKYNRPLLEQKKNLQFEKTKINTKIKALEEDNELIGAKRKYLEKRVEEIGTLIRRRKRNINSDVIREMIKEKSIQAKTTLQEKRKQLKKTRN